MKAICLLIATVIGFINNAESLETTACYGTMITPSCSSGEILRLNGLYAIAKKTSTGCPEAGNVSAYLYPDTCCTYNTQDCKMDYTGGSKSDYAHCVVHSTCSLQVSWQPTTCNETDFLKRSSYMIMDYKCIKGTNSGSTIDLRCGTSALTTSPGVSVCQSVVPSDAETTLGSGQISGIVVGILVLLLLLILIIIVVWKKKRGKTRPSRLDPMKTTGGGIKNAWGTSNTTGMSPPSSTIKHTS